VKVLHLLSSAGHYGAENLLLTLADALKRTACESVIGVFENTHTPNLEVATSARARGMTVEQIHCKGRFDPQVRVRIADIAVRHGVDVIHTHGYKSDVYGYWAARRAQLPIVATCHGWPGTSLGMRGYYALDRFILRNFDALVTVSPSARHILEQAGISAALISQIDNGVDCSAFASSHVGENPARLPGTAPRIGFVGRLSREKGIHFLLEAAKAVVAKHPKVSFVLIGEGPEHAHLEALCGRLGIAGRVFFLGARRDMPDVYSSMDIFVLPSLSENMPVTILEAMAAGKPVIATSVGAVPAVIIPEKTGLLVQPEDVVGLTSALLRYLSDAPFANAMGQNAGERVKTSFSAEAMAQKYTEVYRRIARKRTALVSALITRA
jgi:glycosyltransferase involved in cell wall biosynthesis